MPVVTENKASAILLIGVIHEDRKVKKASTEYKLWREVLSVGKAEVVPLSAVQ